ncbi:hypothetical protein NKJ40_31655 [Mesorhizobium sp. M0119]|uniref:ABC transporter ATP-binding protein n=1 Tax=Mesorhizobium sp. M0119 TaxID=2956885 RepID=UPI00333AC2A9
MDGSERVFGQPRHPYTQLLLNSILSVPQGSGARVLKDDTAETRGDARASFIHCDIRANGSLSEAE